MCWQVMQLTSSPCVPQRSWTGIYSRTRFLLRLFFWRRQMPFGGGIVAHGMKQQPQSSELRSDRLYKSRQGRESDLLATTRWMVSMIARCDVQCSVGKSVAGGSRRKVPGCDYEVSRREYSGWKRW